MEDVQKTANKNKGGPTFKNLGMWGRGNVKKKLERPDKRGAC